MLELYFRTLKRTLLSRSSPILNNFLLAVKDCIKKLNREVFVVRQSFKEIEALELNYISSSSQKVRLLVNRENRTSELHHNWHILPIVG